MAGISLVFGLASSYEHSSGLVNNYFLTNHVSLTRNGTLNLGSDSKDLNLSSPRWKSLKLDQPTTMKDIYIYIYIYIYIDTRNIATEHLKPSSYGCDMQRLLLNHSAVGHVT